MTSSLNWIHNLVEEPSTKDKIKSLLNIGYKLVLVQLHELERIKNVKMKEPHYEYVGQLYQHYVIEGLPKMYIKDV